MNRKFFLFSLLISVGLAIALLVHPHVTMAAFNPNNVMDDVVFDNSSAMNAAQIDSWLNANFPSSCISTNRGFSSADPTGYSPAGGFTYSGVVSAGKVIYDAAQAYNISPAVLLVTLQKEQSLVSGGGGCGALAYTGAMGYGCPDSGTTHSYPAEGALSTPLYYINGNPVTSVSGTCVNSAAKAGFSEQVIHGAWLLKFGEQRSEGNTSWAVIKGNWDNSDDPQSCYGGPMTQGLRKRCSTDASAVFYDGYITIDNTSTHMDTGATAALYWYTPHFSGNQNFDTIYQQWFGTPYANYSWQLVSQAVYTDSSRANLLGWGANLQTNGQAYVVLIVANTGDVTWSNTGSNPIDLGTAQPGDRTSAFCTNSWSSCTRPARLQESSVAPGQWGTFAFPISAPTTPGQYNEHFNLLAEGITWFNDPGEFLQLNVQPQSFTWQPVSQGVFADSSMTSFFGWGAMLTPGQSAYVELLVANTSNFTWTQTGATSVWLGTSHQNDRSSAFCTNQWPGTGCNRAGQLQQASVAPGQWATFGFPVTAPGSPGVYSEYFNLVSSSWFSDVGQHIDFTVVPKQFSWQPTSQAIYTNSGKSTLLGWGATLNTNQSAYAVINAENTSNFTWTNSGSNSIDLGTWAPAERSSPFFNVGWLRASRPATMTQSSVGAGQVATFQFPITAPSTPGQYNEHFNLVSEGQSWFGDPGQFFQFSVH